MSARSTCSGRWMRCRTSDEGGLAGGADEQRGDRGDSGGALARGNAASTGRRRRHWAWHRPDRAGWRYPLCTPTNPMDGVIKSSPANTILPADLARSLALPAAHLPSAARPASRSWLVCHPLAGSLAPAGPLIQPAGSAVAGRWILWCARGPVYLRAGVGARPGAQSTKHKARSRRCTERITARALMQALAAVAMPDAIQRPYLLGAVLEALGLYLGNCTLEGEP